MSSVTSGSWTVTRTRVLDRRVFISKWVNEKNPAWDQILTAHDAVRLIRRQRWILSTLTILEKFPQKRRFAAARSAGCETVCWFGWRAVMLAGRLCFGEGSPVPAARVQQYLRSSEKSWRMFHPPVCPTVSSDLPRTTHFDPGAPVLKTLDLDEAAAFLRMHPEEVRSRTKRGLIPGAEMFKSLQQSPRQYRYLDAAQLVKHYLGLKHSYPAKTRVLMYLYWEPTNADTLEEFTDLSICDHASGLFDVKREYDAVGVAKGNWRDFGSGNAPLHQPVSRVSA